MPLNKRTTRVFHRTLYAGILEGVTILKRNPDQQQGVVVAIPIFQCRWSKSFKTAEPIAFNMSADHTRKLHIPRVELDRVGIEYLNADDRFVDKTGAIWQVESTNTITVKLFTNHVDFDCRKVVSGGPS